MQITIKCTIVNLLSNYNRWIQTDINININKSDRDVSYECINEKDYLHFKEWGGDINIFQFYGNIAGVYFNPVTVSILLR